MACVACRTYLGRGSHRPIAVVIYLQLQCSLCRVRGANEAEVAGVTGVAPTFTPPRERPARGIHIFRAPRGSPASFFIALHGQGSPLRSV
jgi:hypothetical protein